jgi:hypothetical protein
MSKDSDVPIPGREGAPDAPSEPDDEVLVDEEHDTITRNEESGVGPGAGESPIVRVTTPVQHEKADETTQHPTLRDDEDTP